MTQLFSKVMAPWLLGMWERAEKAWFIFFNNLFSLYNLKLIIEAKHQCLSQDPSGLGYFFESKIDPLLILSLSGPFHLPADQWMQKMNIWPILGIFVGKRDHRGFICEICREHRSFAYCCPNAALTFLCRKYPLRGWTTCDSCRTSFRPRPKRSCGSMIVKRRNCCTTGATGTPTSLRSKRPSL